MTITAALLAQITPQEPEARPPAVYRYLICRANDGLILDELPLSTNSLPRRIGTDTTTQFSLPLNDPRTGPQWAGLTDPRRVPMVVALRDERPAWWGLITTQRGVNVLDLGAVSIEGYFARRIYPTDYAAPEFRFPIVFEQEDQLRIAQAIFANAIGLAPVTMTWDVGPIDDLGEPGAPTSGVLRDRTYAPEEGTELLGVVQDLAGVNNGFEWTWELDYAPGDTNVTPRLVLAYPKLGIRSPEPEWRFELGVGGVGGNLIDYDLLVDCSAGKFATEVISFGAGEGEARLISEEARNLEWEHEVGLRIQQPTIHSTVKRQTTLDNHAIADQEALDRGEAILTATARGDLDPRFGQYHLGDDCRAVVEDTSRHPRRADGSPGLDVLTRIIGWDLDPSTDRVKLDLEGVDV